MPPTQVFGRPRVYAASGCALPPALALLHRSTRLPGRPGIILRRALARVVIGRLPELVVRYPDGRAFRIPAADPDYASIFFYDHYESEESTLISRVLRAGEFAIDVGANLGWYSILMSAAVGSGGSVWAFEPVPATGERLRANLALNPGHVVSVHLCALGASTGVTEIHTFGGLPHGHASASTFGRDDFVPHRVAAQTLDCVLAAAGAGAPVLIKLDAEGAELDVLRGAARLLSSPAPPIWTIEVNRHTAGVFGYEPPALIEQLRRGDAGYGVYRIQSGTLVPETDPASAHGITWVCVPNHLRDRVFASLPVA